MALPFRQTLIGFLILLCSTATAQRIFEGQDPVPPEFGKAPGTVLVMLSDKKNVNKALEEVFGEYYKGPFKLVEMNAVNTEAHSDLQQFRYCFRTVIGYLPASGSGEHRMPASNTYTFAVDDRVSNTTNGLDFEGSAFKGLMKDYVKKLEEIRARGH